jgi:hypothetical protein
MDTNTPQPRTPAATHRHHSLIRTIAAISIFAIATSAAAQTRQSGGRLVPDQPFETVWVIDREMPAFEVLRTLTHVTSSEGFQPVVLHSGRDFRWTASLQHLLWLLPQGDSVWVSETETMFDVDRLMSPAGVALLDPSDGPMVYSADESFDPVAALIAMRLDGVLTAEMPATGGPSVFVGIDGPRVQAENSDVYLSTREDAVAYANQLAERRVVMVVPSGELLPEYILWAFQRDAKILEVTVPPYSIYDAPSEIAAVSAVSTQIRAAGSWLLDGETPEALVIAGDWHRIPFRFPRDNPNPCSGCDNQVFEYSADVEYANLDGDPWGEPDVPVGRLMSPFQDLLAIQCVVGLWREKNAFAAATDGVVLDLLGPRGGLRDEMAAAWQQAYPEQIWSTMGPEPYDPQFRLDREAFFRLADRSDVVVANGHGSPDGLSPNGSPFYQSIWGTQLVERELTGWPAFWFVHACSTGKPDMDDEIAEQTLLVGLQSRLAYGSLMAVEVLGAGSGDPSWWTTVLDPDLSIGELVRRYTTASISVYREGGSAPMGMAQPTGDPVRDRFNAYPVLSWIGDPLTPMEITR